MMERYHKLPLTALVGVVAFFAGLLIGLVASERDLEVQSCATGEVYVVDTKRCVAADDHAGHMGNDEALPEMHPHTGGSTAPIVPAEGLWNGVQSGVNPHHHTRAGA